jgi:nitrate reductase gamma subunit
VPRSWTAAIGVDDASYHALAAAGGIAAGAAVCVGFALLVYRRIRFPRVRRTTTSADVITFGLLALGIVTGMLATLTNLGDAVHYRESVGPYFRNLLVLNPEPELMTGAHVTFIFQAHVTVVWLLFAYWPFSRLVHAWSVPIDYSRRSPIVYRSQHAGSRARRGTAAVAPAAGETREA